MESRFNLFFLSFRKQVIVTILSSSLASVKPCASTVWNFLGLLEMSFEWSENSVSDERCLFSYSKLNSVYGKKNPVTQDDQIVSCIAVCKNMMGNYQRASMGKYERSYIWTVLTDMTT